MQTRPPRNCLLCSFRSSVRDFAADFLQIPPHGGHPYLWLTVPTAKSVADFHRRVTHPCRAHIKGDGKHYCLPPPVRMIFYFMRFYSSENISSNRVRIAATCARVASPFGSRMPLPLPVISPFATAHFIGSTA